MSSIGPTELVVVLVLVILLYAFGRLPEFGGALSKVIGENKQAAKGTKSGRSIGSDDHSEEGASTAGPKI